MSAERRLVRLAVLAQLLLLLAATGCASGWETPGARFHGWHSVETAGVRLLGDITSDEMQRLGDDLALFDATFDHLAGWPPTEETGSITIFLLRDPKLVRSFHLGRGIAGWALPTLDGGFATVAATGSYSSTRSTLFHEYTHLLLRHNRRAPLPPWYDEGLASFFGTLYERDGGVVVGGPPQAAVARVLSSPLPVAELLEGDIWGRRGRGVADFYATSWALSHYLLLSPTGRREMSRLVEQLSRGATPEEAQRAAFGRSSEALESELRRHVAYLARGVPAEVVIDAERLAVRGAGPPATLPVAEVTGSLGLLALELARSAGESSDRKFATRFLEMTPQPRAAPTDAALAEALALAGRVQDAAVALERSLAHAPGDPRVQRHAGRAALARAEAAEGDAVASALDAAEAHFRRSISLDARSASAWFGLGRTLRRAGYSDDAGVAFRKARRLGWSPFLDLALGELELERGQTQQAVELLWPLAQDPHGGPASEASARLLERSGLLPGKVRNTER